MIVNRRLLLAAVAACLFLGPAVGRVAAQAQIEIAPATKGPHTWNPEAEKAISELRSPYCPELMLSVCSSTGGAALRDSLEQMAEAGVKADSLVQWVLGRYGPQWLVVPPADARGIVIWVMPFLAVAAGVGVTIFALRRFRRSTPLVVGHEVSAEEDARLTAALREIESEEEPLF
jgi:cytochrome c-type biogenesis protein CcmH